MKLTCPSCPDNKVFIVPLWVRATFKINDDGTLTILHVRQLESLEEKLTDQGKTSSGITCQECGSEAEVNLIPYQGKQQLSSEHAALEGL